MELPDSGVMVKLRGSVSPAAGGEGSGTDGDTVACAQDSAISALCK